MEQIACKECTSPYCHGCNMYRLERMLMSGKLDALMDENRAIKMDADVRPVERGKWKPFDLTYGRSYYYCTACERTVDMPTAMGIPMFNFCPNCGADMREES